MGKRSQGEQHNDDDEDEGGRGAGARTRVGSTSTTLLGICMLELILSYFIPSFEEGGRRRRVIRPKGALKFVPTSIGAGRRPHGYVLRDYYGALSFSTVPFTLLGE